MLLPKNVYRAVKILYDICGIYYFHYTRFLNQTMGNLMILHVQKLYCQHIVPKQNTYVVRAVFGTLKQIHASIVVKLFTDDLVFISTIKITCVHDIGEETTKILLHKLS